MASRKGGGRKKTPAKRAAKPKGSPAQQAADLLADHMPCEGASVEGDVLTFILAARSAYPEAAAAIRNGGFRFTTRPKRIGPATFRVSVAAC